MLKSYIVEYRKKYYKYKKLMENNNELYDFCHYAYL